MGSINRQKRILATENLMHFASESYIDYSSYGYQPGFYDLQMT